MSPENANVFLVEDDKSFRGYARRFIEGAGHKIVVEVDTFQGALEAISSVKALGVNVAVVDGNLTEEDFSGDDGSRIAAVLREEIPGIKIISFSGNKQSYGDIHVSKCNIEEVKNLGKSITTL